MALPAHPRLHNRGAAAAESAERAAAEGGLVRVLVYAPSSARAAWVESELRHDSVMVQIGFSIEQVVSALVEDPPPRPQLLVADFDDMDAGELLHLHVLREQAWFGRIIALGAVPHALRISLSIECVLDAPFVRDALRDVIINRTFHNTFVDETTKLPVL